MVRGNWQRRVEKTEARRQETKQRKQRTEDKKAFKGWVRTFLNQLDAHQEVIRKRKCTIHIWTDALPTSGPPLLDLLEEHHGKGGKKGAVTKRQEGVRNRSASIESEGSTGGAQKLGKKGSPSKRGGRNRSASIESEGSTGGGGPRKPNNSPSKRKVHPRSKESLEFMDNAASANDSLPMLCRQHFLYGKCDNRNGKKGVCPHVHYTSSKYMSLSSVLNPSAPLGKSGIGNSREIIQHVEAALVMANDPTTSSSNTPTSDIALSSESTTSGSTMDMLYYSVIHTQQSMDDPASSLSEDIAAEFARTQTPLATMVYVAIDHVLVFDRNQEGMLTDSMNTCISDIISSFRKSSISGEQDGQTSSKLGETVDYAHLPGAVLEHMLTFLPDAAVSSCSQVCRSWNHEIGQHSPNLWTHLLERNGWPSISDVVIVDHRLEDSNEGEEHHQQLRKMFVDHHVAMRDMEALGSAIPPILSQAAHASIEEKEVTFQAFNARKHSPQETDICAGAEEWSPNHVLAGYSNECTLRLFQAVPFRGKHKRCKELVCQSVDPYKSTKKRSCSLDAFGLDEDMIGCLCHVSSTRLDSDIGASILVVVRRDDFLMGESSAVAAKGGGNGIYAMTDELQVIDIGEAVLNYILSCDDVDHRLLPLFDYLNDGGEVGDVCVTTTRKHIAACGYGRFMIEVSVSIPNDQADLNEENAAENEEEFIQLDRKLVLFSASAGAIVWMGDSYPSNTLPPASSVPAIVSTLRRPRLQGGSRNSCSLAFGSLGSKVVLTCDIDPSGSVDIPTTVSDSEMARTSFLSSMPEYDASSSHALIMTPTVLIAHDTIYHALENGEMTDVQSMLFFFHRYPDNPGSPFSTLALSGKLRIHDMMSLRDRYVVLFCTKYTSHVSPDDEVDAANDDAGVEDTQEGGTSLTVENEVLVVVHIASCQEIGRVSLSTLGAKYKDIHPRFITTPSGGTIALALGGLGIAITGEDVRGLSTTLLSEDDDAGQHNNNNSKTGRKKKPARSKKGGSKKDGFARGMSLRG